MDAVEKIRNIVNNKSVGNAIFNLYGRWRDESDYEDINEYGECITKVIKKQFPQYGVTLVSSTKKPFGVKVNIDERKFHIYVKKKGYYIAISVKEC